MSKRGIVLLMIGLVAVLILIQGGMVAAGPLSQDTPCPGGACGSPEGKGIFGPGLPGYPSEAAPANQTQPENQVTPEATVSTTDQTPPVTPPAAENKDSSSSIPLPVLIGIGVLAVILVGVLIYFLVIQPRRKRAKLIEAQKLVASDRPEDLERADSLLNAALVAGMRARDVAEARFTQAYVRARLGRYAEGAAVLADLLASGSPSAETLYLEIWLQFKLEKYEAVERVYDKHHKALEKLLDSPTIVGIAYLRLARQCWLRNEVKEALDYYQKVRRLNVPELNSRIPENMDDQQVVIGIRALLDKRFEEARAQFETICEQASEGGRSTVQGELGLLLCDWRTNSDNVDGRLKELLETLRAETPPAPEPVDEDEDITLPAPQRLLRNALFWHTITLIVGWQRFPIQSGLPDGEQDILNERLAAVRAVDPQMADAELVAGLIVYYFAPDIATREAAVKKLKTYADQGGNLADVLALVEREEKAAELYRQSLDRYLAIAKSYLQDPTVKEDLRQKLLERLKPYERFRQLGEIDLRKGESDAAPSIEDLQNRSRLLRTRVEKVIKPKLEQVGKEVSSVVTEQVKEVDELTKTLTKNSNSLQQAEFGLLATAGELLLQEEPQPPADEIRPATPGESEANDR